MTIDLETIYWCPDHGTFLKLEVIPLRTLNFFEPKCISFLFLCFYGHPFIKGVKESGLNFKSWNDCSCKNEGLRRCKQWSVLVAMLEFNFHF